MATWAYEGIQCYVATNPFVDSLVMLPLDGVSVPVPVGKHEPLYRAWNGKDHFYTMSKTEYDGLPSQYSREGVACYILNKQLIEHLPLYRLYKGSIDDHFYTTSDDEKNSAISTGYTDEGTVGYVRVNPSPRHVPLYRVYYPGIGDHFYTTSMAEIEIEAVLVISLRGVLWEDIHNVVDECTEKCGYKLKLDKNWLKDKGDMLASDGDAKRIRNKINILVSKNGGNKSKLSLLVVGKSAGGVLAWNTFKRHYGDIDDFNRAALVMVDPHGAVDNDGKFGAYQNDQDLWWPSNWSSDTNFLRVYNIWQEKGIPTGASFPDSRVYKNIKISESGISHRNISGHAQTRKLIKEAFIFCLHRVVE